jgi:hypothetical protein
MDLNKYYGRIGHDKHGVRFIVLAENDSYELKGGEVVILSWHFYSFEGSIPAMPGEIVHISKLTSPLSFESYEKLEL